MKRNRRSRSSETRRVSYGTPTWVWSVAVDGALYVRAYNGTASRWYQAALQRKVGRITAAGMTRDVTFEPVDGTINEAIDEAYRRKYQDSPYLRPMVGRRAQAATFEVRPRRASRPGANEEDSK